MKLRYKSIISRSGLTRRHPRPIGGIEMLVVHFKVQCQPERTAALREALAAVIAPARATDGVISFDIAEDLTDPNVLVATEVFADRAARERQESLPEVAAVMALLPDSIAAPPQVDEYSVAEPALP
jgi:quinol monooxygenase YgiN